MEADIQTCIEDLYYEDGHLYWKDDGSQASWFDTSGYYRVNYNGKFLLEHRIIFAMFNGYLPEIVDHIDCDKMNNVPANLRECPSRAHNVVNSELRCDNTTGYRGVINHKRCNGYVAQASCKGRRVHLGVFLDPKEAALAYNYHAEKTYGPFARFNQVFEDVVVGLED